jgi:hypothetical protein
MAQIVKETVVSAGTTARAWNKKTGQGNLPARLG